MPIASFTLDHAARITSWSAEASTWLGYPAAEVLGRHCSFLLPRIPPDAPAEALDGPGAGRRRVVPLAFGDGTSREVALTCYPLTEESGRTGLLCQVGEVEQDPADDLPPRSEVRMAFTDALMRTSPFGLGVLDNDLRYVVVNDALAEFNGIPAGEHIGARVGEVVRAADGGEYEKHLRRVLESGDPLHNVLIASRSQGRPDRDKVWSVTFFRLTGRSGRVLGLGGLIVDVTQKETALLDASAVRQRLTLVNRAGSRVGTTLEMAGTARELARFAVPEFADAATVEMRKDFLAGGAFPAASLPVTTIRLAGRSELGMPADELLPADAGSEHVHPVGSRSHQALSSGRSWNSGPLDEDAVAELARQEAAVWPFQEDGLGSLIAAPLIARGRCLGLVQFARSSDREPLNEDDLKVAEELATRTALSLDNARLYDEERRIAVALQRNMLPDDDDIIERPGLEVGYHYWSTSRSARVGGDWFDVIPLSGHRVALVVGDMMGHDIQAAAGMGQLRTAMHTLAGLDLEPVDLLNRLDAIVDNSRAMQHATCVYAVYNTVTRECSIANAGHPPPVLRYRDDTTEIVPVEPGVPLGIGLDEPEFAVVNLELPEDSTLVLYTDGLIERRGQDIEDGIEALRAALTDAGPVESVQRLCDDVVTVLTDRAGDDDLAVLMARVTAMPGHRSVRWRVAARVDAVPRTRALLRRTLDEWGLRAIGDSTELLMSELLTNAVRHAKGEVEIQVACGETLVVEVTDDDERLPHLIRADVDEERGRGLAVVDALAQQWGARSVTSGKVVWFELPLARRDGQAPPHRAARGRFPGGRRG